MLDSHSEEQATEAEIARKKHTKFPGKQKWKNGEMFYILKNEEETANIIIRFCNFNVKNIYSKKKKIKAESEEASTVPTSVWHSYYFHELYPVTHLL